MSSACVLYPQHTFSDTPLSSLMHNGFMGYITLVLQIVFPSLSLSLSRPWCESTLHEACHLLSSELSLPSNAPGGMPEYRTSLVASFFFKFYLTVLSQLDGEPLPNELISAPRPVKRDLVRSTQGFQKICSQQSPEDTIGRPLMHVSALQQATGEARYSVCTYYLSHTQPCTE